MREENHVVLPNCRKILNARCLPECNFRLRVCTIWAAPLLHNLTCEASNMTLGHMICLREHGQSHPSSRRSDALSLEVGASNVEDLNSTCATLQVGLGHLWPGAEATPCFA